MIHPDTELRFISPVTGHGVVARHFLPRGTITWVRDPFDQVINARSHAALPGPLAAALDHFCYRRCDGSYLLCWDHARYMNHSFTPNCLLTPYEVEIAVCDIHPGEELTNDYGLFNLREPFTPHERHEDRSLVLPDDLPRHAREWDTRITAALKDFPSLPQALAPLFPDGVAESLQEVALGLAALRSTLELFHRPDIPGGFC